MVCVFRLSATRALIVFLLLLFYESRAYPVVVGGMLCNPPLVSWFESFGVFGCHFGINVGWCRVRESPQSDPFGCGNGVVYEFIQVLLIGMGDLGARIP